MGLLSYLIPELNKPDKTEDPKIANALTAIEQWANGGIDEKNLTTAYAAFVAQLIPTGSVMPYAGAAAPSNWLLCNGSAVSRATYSKLFELIGTAFGEGDKVTTFNVPDLRERIPVGAGGTFVRGAKGGEAAHTLAGNEIPASLGTGTATNGGGAFIFEAPAGWGGWLGHISEGGGGAGTRNVAGTPGSPMAEANGGQPHNNLQPYTVLNYIVRT
jgi:microcystin-dependent protein